MAKTKSDLGYEGHQRGDADGRGLHRGMSCAFWIEVAAALLYGLLLLVTNPASALQ